jgi:lipoprotein NlpI
LSLDPSPRPSLPIAAALLVVACFLYLGMMGSISDLGSTDAAGRGMGLGFGAMFGLALWIVLGVLLIVGAVKGEMPLWAGIAALILVPAGAVAAAIATEFIEYHSGWQIIVPALLPPLIAFYAMWARLPQIHGALPPTMTSAIVWGAVLILNLAPLPRYTAEAIATAERATQRERESKAQQTAEDQRRRENLARFEKLTPDSPLWEWAEFIGQGSELDKQAVAGAQKLAHRQADAEFALQRGMGFPLVEYSRLDLDVTPGLCAAANQFLRDNAASHPLPDVDADAAYALLHQNFSPYLDSVEWLTQSDCDIDDAVASIARTVAAYPQSSSRDGLLGVLAWRRGNGFYKREAYDRALASYDEAIRLDPDNAQFFDSRGNVHYDRADYDRAIADYDEAIRRNKFYSAAFDSRANAYHAKGEDDRAIEDYDEAIRLNPEFALAFNNRGNLYNGKGEHERAIRNFDEALRLAPKFCIALNNRGRARFYQAAYEAAAADFTASLQLRPTDPYTVLWIYLARARSGQSARDLMHGDAGPLDRTAWPWPIVDAYLGSEDAAAVLAAARRGDQSSQKDRECEADFYLGAKAASESDSTAAHELLQRARTICPADFIENLAAKFELARLRQ